jgi:hypothetical protein
MHRQRTVAVLRQYQYEHPHHQITQADYDQQPPRKNLRKTQGHDGAEDQHPVGDGIKDLPDPAHLIETSRYEAVDAVGSRGNGDQYQ